MLRKRFFHHGVSGYPRNSHGAVGVYEERGEEQGCVLGTKFGRPRGKNAWAVSQSFLGVVVGGLFLTACGNKEMPQPPGPKDAWEYPRIYPPPEEEG